MEWISVKDKLPEIVRESVQNDYKVSERVLVVTKDGNVYIAECEIDGGSYYNIYWVDEPGETLKNVTHWMPLPEPPNE